jgi:hypothetical protein
MKNKREKCRHYAKFKNIKSRREKEMPVELLRIYPKNANLPNPKENIQLPP